MKSRILTCFTMMTLLAALAIPIGVRLSAQEQQQQQQQSTRVQHYKLTVLDTLGGTCSGAQGINNNGKIVGSACLPGDTAIHASLWSRAS